MADQKPVKVASNGEPSQFGTGDTVGTAHGGTGAVDAAGALANIGAASSADLESLFVTLGSDCYGDGTDGAITYSSNTTLTSDVHATTILVDSNVVVTCGWNSSEGRPVRIFATTSISLWGNIASSGSNGGNNTTSKGGAGGASTTGGGGGGGGYTPSDTGGNAGVSGVSGRDGEVGQNGADSDGGPEGNDRPLGMPTGDALDFGWDLGGRGGNGTFPNGSTPGGGGGGGGGVVWLASPQIYTRRTSPSSSNGAILATGGNGGTGGSGIRGGEGGDGGAIVIVQRFLRPEITSLYMDVRGGIRAPDYFGPHGSHGYIIFVSELACVPVWTAGDLGEFYGLILHVPVKPL